MYVGNMMNPRTRKYIDIDWVNVGFLWMFVLRDIQKNIP
jgi:hypothetical protein